MEIEGYWNRRGGYEKLDRSVRQRRKTSSNDVAAEPVRKRRSSWRSRFLKFDKVVAVGEEAKKLCGGLRDAYVDFMNRNADVRVVGDGMGGGYGGFGDDGFGRMKNLKDYDEEIIMEMYKSVTPVVAR